MYPYFNVIKKKDYKETFVRMSIYIYIYISEISAAFSVQ